MKINSLLYIVLLVSSCASMGDKDYDRFLEKYPNKDGYNQYFILPFLGCQGCYSQAERFTIENSIEYERVGFYIIGSGSEKMMRIRFSSEVIDRKNVTVISQSETQELALDHIIYPTILNLENSNLLSVIIPNLDSLHNELVKK